MLRQGLIDSSSSTLPLCGSSHHDSRHSTVPVPRMWLLLASAVLFLPWGLYTRTKSQFVFTSDEIKEMKASQTKMVYQADMKRQLMEAFQADKKRYIESNEAFAKEVRKTGGLVYTHADTYEALEKKEESMISRIDDLESHIQENSRFAIEEEHGKGPYKVKLVVRSKVHMRIKRQTLVLELASTSMPHSVHHFMRMLTQRLWEGMSFMPQQSAPHRIQAFPVDMETLDSMDWRFENAKLKNLAFAEHSGDYRCGPYSVGFSGNPGGPDFYINGFNVPEKLANDSCFGRVIEGKNVIDSIVEKQESAVLGIESLRLLPNEEVDDANV